MTDFENNPVGTMKELERLRAENKTLRARGMIAEGMTVTEIRNAINYPKNVTAAAGRSNRLFPNVD